MSSGRKKTVLRAVIATVYLLGMFALYGSERDVIWWFWILPLAIALLIYHLILWSGRCPDCREEFSLKPDRAGRTFDSEYVQELRRAT